MIPSIFDSTDSTDQFYLGFKTIVVLCFCTFVDLVNVEDDFHKIESGTSEASKTVESNSHQTIAPYKLSRSSMNSLYLQNKLTIGKIQHRNNPGILDPTRSKISKLSWFHP